ncbi:MAG: toxin TcdB middle/N-terminal domain-containing protein, partial [Polyangiaceae bacterium]
MRWVAPYHGTVAFGGPLQRKFADGGDVLAEVWRNGATTAAWSRVFSSSDVSVCTPGPSDSCAGGFTFTVQAGDRLYFRTRAQGDIADTALLWDPQLSYQTVCNGSVCSPVSAADHARVEPWGASVFDFSQARDFRLAGPPDRGWPMQLAATNVPVSLQGVFQKLAPTADDVTLEIFQTTASNQRLPLFSVSIPAAQVKTMDLGAMFASSPFLMSATVNGAQLAADSLHFRVRSQTPVDPAAFQWDPVVTYRQYCRTPPTENSTQVCGEVSCPDGPDDTPCTMNGDPMPENPLRRGQVVQRVPVTYSSYLVEGRPNGVFLTDNLPTQAFPAPEAGPFEATLTYALGSSPMPSGVDDTVLVVQGNQRIFGGATVAPGQASTTVVSGTIAAVNEPLYFTALRKGGQELQFSATVRFTNSGQVYTVPPAALNRHRVRAWDDVNERDNFSGGYQQWSTVQWTETPPKAGAAIPVFTGDAVEAPLSFSNDASAATTSPIAPTVPLRSGLPGNALQQLPGFPGPVWVSSGADLYIAAGEMKPSRSGSNPQSAIAQASSAAFRKSHGSTSELGFSLIAGVAQSTSDSSGDTDTLDMNGDRYPDFFDGQSVRLGDGNGGFGAPIPVGAGAEVRKFTGAHSRFGISGGATGGAKQTLSASGKAQATTGVSASAGRIYGRTRTTADLVDVNGDGLPDRVERSDGGAAFMVRLNLGYSFGPAFEISNVPAFTHGIPSDAVEFSADANDSGSLRVQTDLTNSIQGGVGVGDGVGFNGGGGLAYVTTRTLVDFADVNGDGLPDRVLKVPGDNALRVELNLGEQFAPEQVWNLPAWGDGELPSGGPLSIFGSRDALSYSEGSQFHLDVGFSYEFVIFLAICGSVEAAAQYRHTHVTSQLDLTDVDGDGFADQLLKRDDTGSVHVKLNQDGAQHFNLLKTVENPIGGKLTLDYSREGNTPELPENQWVLANVTVDDGLTGALHDTVHSTAFQYAGGLYNREERQNFGFSNVTTIRPDQSKVVQSFRQDLVCTKGLLGSTVEQDAAGHLFRSSQTVYDLRAAGSADSCFPAATQGVTSFFEGLTTDITKPGKTLAEQRDYDAFGNVVFYSNAGDIGAADDLSYTVQYDPALVPAHIFRATLVTAFDAQNKVLRERQATYFGTGSIKTLNDLVNGGHDPATGAPYVNKLTPDWVFSYVADGNLETSTDPTGFHLLYSYDPGTFTYITSTLDSFGYTSTADPDPGLGVFKSITDTNGYTETFTYNRIRPCLLNMQAPAEALTPGAPQTVTINYSSLAPGARVLPAYTVVHHFDVTNPTNSLQTATFVDGLGRVIQTKKEADVDNGSGGTLHGFMVSGPTLFDERGRVRTQGQPVFSTDAAGTLTAVSLARSTQYQYDILSRPTSVVEPNGGAIGTAYSIGLFDGIARFTTTLTDPNNNKRITYQDVRGQVVGIDQFNTIAGANRTLTTRYAYNPLGELLQVTDAKGNKTTSVFDTVGHLVDLTSPDSGHTSYRYDLAGRLIAKQTPNLVTANKVITFAYDFNRLKSLDLPSTPGVIDYQYSYGESDDPQGEVGRLVHITDPSGDEARFYDELGRMSSSQFTPTPQSTTAPKPSYTTQFKYDSLGRLLALTYPDGEVVSYGYDGGGALNSVSGKPANASATTLPTPYVQKITYDEFGQRKSITLGNGAVTKYSYDPNMRWLTDINTASGTATIQNNHYTFDNVGNILTAANNIAIPAPVSPNGPIAPGPTTQTFGYDQLYQLTSASGRYDGCACGCNNHRDYTYAQSYDEIGNIKTKVLTDKITWPTGGRVDTQP